MKELHNNIFSNTTCISKEIMLKYINKQLTKSESYEVEKHMIDCDLCTDAMAGMKFATNSSILFAIDHQIDKRAERGLGKAAIMKNLMVAASILVVVSGTYFTYNLFNNTTESEFAINGDDKEVSNNNDENFILKPISDSIVENKIEKEEGFSLSNNLNKQESIQLPSVEKDTPPRVASAPIEEVSEITLADEAISSQEEVEEDELAFGDLYGYEADVEGEENENQSLNNKDYEVTNSRNGFFSAKESNKANLASSSRSNQKKREKSKSSKYKHQNTIYIEGYKAYDYSREYENAEILRESALPKSISPDFSSEEDKIRADIELEKVTIKVTYQETLERGLQAFKRENYIEALGQFDLILKKHPKDVNALFYSGLSNYHSEKYDKTAEQLELVLKNRQTEFNQEAEWYNALTLVELKKEKKAKKVLEKIVANNGFYKTKALEKLKELEE